MTEVYLVTSVDYGSRQVEAVFSRRDYADKFVDLYDGDLGVEIYELDANVDMIMRDMTTWTADLDERGNIVSMSDSGYSECDMPLFHVWRPCRGGEICVRIYDIWATKTGESARGFIEHRRDTFVWSAGMLGVRDQINGFFLPDGRVELRGTDDSPIAASTLVGGDE